MHIYPQLERRMRGRADVWATWLFGLLDYLGFPSPLDGGGVGLEPNRFTLKVVPILISRLYQALFDQDVLAVDPVEGYLG